MERARRPAAFVRHGFLSALIDTGCASAQTGWLPQFLLVRRVRRADRGDAAFREVAFVWRVRVRLGLGGAHSATVSITTRSFSAPYLLPPFADRACLAPRKSFRCCARARARQLLAACAIPGGGGARALRETRHADPARGTVSLAQRRLQRFRRLPHAHDARAAQKIRQERRRVTGAGVLPVVRGTRHRTPALGIFSRCYRKTYAEHRSSPYLSLDFFCGLAPRCRSMSPWWSLSETAGRSPLPFSCTTSTRSTDATGARSNTCRSCTSSAATTRQSSSPRQTPPGVRRRCPGRAQALARPASVEAPSAHWLAHPKFARAVEQFLEREGAGITRYVDELCEHSPFRDKPCA